MRHVRRVREQQLSGSLMRRPSPAGGLHERSQADGGGIECE